MLIPQFFRRHFADFLGRHQTRLSFDDEKIAGHIGNVTRIGCWCYNEEKQGG